MEKGRNPIDLGDSFGVFARNLCEHLGASCREPRINGTTYDKAP